MTRATRIALMVALVAFGAAACAGGCDKKKNSGGPAYIPPNDNPAPTGSNLLKGTAKLLGDVPAPVPWGGTSTGACRALHDATIQLVSVADGKIADVFVWVKDGLPNGTYEVPTNKVTIDQKGCEFHPRVFGLRVGQPLEGVNSDPFLHNIDSPDFNAPFPVAGARKDLDLHTEGVMVTIKCDVHGWMRAYAGVMTHPYWAVTGTDGAFSMSGLPDGEYTVAAWHETLGTKEQKVKLAAGAPNSIDFEFKK